MDFQRNLVWIVLGAVLLLGVAGYFVMTPGGSELEELASVLQQREQELSNIAKGANKDDVVKTSSHVRAAKDYAEKVKTQIGELKAHWAAKAVNVKFENVPQDDAQFNIWLDKTRAELKKKLDDAKVRLAQAKDKENSFNKWTFEDPSTDSKSTDPSRHRDVRLKRMAIIDEIVTVLCKKVAKVRTTAFQPESGFEPTSSESDAGAYSWDNITFNDATDTAKAQAAIIKEANTLSGRTPTPPPQPGKGPPPPVELPLNVFSCDLEFTAPAQAVPAILKELEGSQRYYAVLSRIDTKRYAAQPFPSVTEVASLGAGPAPGINTYFQEGPITVRVTLHFYEFDKAKDEAFSKAVEGGAKPAAKKEKQ